MAPLEPRPITTSLPGFSATSLLADQQNKHSDSYQQGKQSTDGKRQGLIPTLNGPRPSAFLRCSETQPEEKFVHSSQPIIGAALWQYAYDYGELSHSASAKSPNLDQGYLARRHHERSRRD
jgi:hypothetical protein